MGLATPFGVNIGRHWASDSKEGAALGGEISAVGVRGERQIWFGGFFGADVMVRSGAAKLALGGELGRWPLGIDAALLWTSLGKEGELGFQTRFHLTGVCSSLYGGWGVTRSISDGDLHHFGVFGLLLKMPVLFEDGHAMLPLPK